MTTFICKHPFSMIEIHPDGNVYPCCLQWCNYYSFGNIFENDFEEIWNGERAREFRKSVLDGTYSHCNLEMCQGTSTISTNSTLEIENSEKLQKFPLYIKFCHDSSCNLCCVICRPARIMNSAEKATQLDAMITPRLLPILRDAKTVSLNGSGELFASKHCRKLVSEVVRQYPEIKFAVHSNGLLCDETNCAELGILDKMSSVQISIHAINKKTYERIVIGSNYDRVWKNVEWLSKLKKAGK